VPGDAAASQQANRTQLPLAFADIKSEQDAEATRLLAERPGILK
jgi:hypothetical protein